MQNKPKRADLRQQFLELNSRRDIEKLLDVTSRQFAFYVLAPKNRGQYRKFKLPKKSGEKRTILAPSPGLKEIQRRLADILATVYEPPACVHGFARQKGPRTNAAPHSRKRYVLNIDIQNFFDSINFGRVRGLFKEVPYKLPAEVATHLAKLCCVQNQLPQGAPTSPIIANMICRRLDSQLTVVAKKFKCRYTRYADDITFSTTLKEFPKDLAIINTNDDGKTYPTIGERLSSLIVSNGFQINPYKSRVMGRLTRQEVTGLVVNRKVNVPREYVRQIRAMFHAWDKFGEDAAGSEFYNRYDTKDRFFNNEIAPFRVIVKGKLDYLSDIKGKSNPVCRELRTQYENLCLGYHRKNDPGDALSVLYRYEKDIAIQGTGFALRYFGLITCNHVVGPGTFIRGSNRGSEEFPAKILRRFPDDDLIVLDNPRPENYTLVAGDSDSCAVGDPISLLGFPNHKDDQSVRKVSGRIAAFAPIFGLKHRCFLLDVPIIYGNSGGPVLNELGHVVGIACRGAKDLEEGSETDLHGVIPINVLRHSKVN